MTELLNNIDQLQYKINNDTSIDAYTFNAIKEYYRVELVYSSNALEYNSLDRIETSIVLYEGFTVAGKPLKHHLEAVGLSDAFDYLYQDATANGFSEEDIKRFHWLFYNKIDSGQAGKYRDIQVYISGSKHSFPAPQDVPTLINAGLKKAKEERGSLHPVVLAAKVHKDFVFIHPFVDGNGRVARLLMNLVLLQEGYNIAIIAPILRFEYIRCLEKAHVDDRDFIKFIAECVKETQQDYLRMFKQ